MKKGKEKGGEKGRKGRSFLLIFTGRMRGEKRK